MIVSSTTSESSTVKCNYIGDLYLKDSSVYSVECIEIGNLLLQDINNSVGGIRNDR